MVIDKKSLDDLYRSYGFKIRPTSSENIKVYTYRSGYFNNADIIAVDGVTDTRKDFEQFRKSGFACKVRDYKSIEDADKELFEGFFALDGTKRRFYDEERKFSHKQADVIGASYQYVSPPYRDVYRAEQRTPTVPLADHLIAELKMPGPRLIILEAAAGYGKTCTSFELLRKSLDELSSKLPFFIELSRNRQAKIFRYVLLDEIDRVFPSLSTNLVELQITKGSLFLIVDGFDELLHRTEAASPDYDKVEPMLETLSDLLNGDAKIVLTSRKTALFSGDHFHTWMESHGSDFEISRYSLLKPEIENWLPHERREALEKVSFPINKISNPVLLAFLRGQLESEFDNLVKNSNEIVRYYFNRLLDREKERQALLMDIDEQYQLFTSLAAHMLEFDFTAEDHEYLQLFISENHSSLLANVRSRYPSESRPTTEELSAKLVSHALLDRKGEESDRVGFVNDFVLGNFIGEHLISSDSDELVVADDFLEQAVASFRPRSEDERIRLFKKLNFSLAFSQFENRVSAEINLCGKPAHSLSGETFSGIAFENTQLGSDHAVKDCVFADCSFFDVTFVMKRIKRVTFVGCRFYDCTFEDIEFAIDSDIFITGCTGDIEKLNAHLSKKDIHRTDSHQSDLDICKKEVLEQFWPVGRPHFRKKKQIITLYKGHSNQERGMVSEAISQLQHDGILSLKGDTAEIDTSNLTELRELLGR